MAQGDMPQQQNVFQTGSQAVGFVDDFMSLFRGKSSSINTNNTKDLNLATTTEEDVSPEKAAALLQQMLEGVNGLAAVSQGQKASGMYSSTVNQLLTNDLLSRSAADVAALSKKVTQTQTGTVTDTSSQQQQKKGALQWIVCTELYKQGRMPHEFYRYGARVFASYDERGKQGYYYWAVPAVKHLRQYPNSKLSKVLEVVMVNRAEYLAAKAGCKTARKTFLGWFLTHSMYAVCWTLSRTIARKPIDFMSAVYPKGV